MEVMRPAAAEFDPELPVIEAVQQGDPDALAELMRRHSGWVRGVVFAVLGRTDEIDDVTQRVWMRVWREASRLEDTRRWRVWLYRIAHNAAMDAGRARRRRRRLLGGLFERRGPQLAAPADRELVQDERHQAMLRAISGLPVIYREPFVLRHLEGWSYEQIAEALDVPKDTIETRLVRARRMLREALSGRVELG